MPLTDFDNQGPGEHDAHLLDDEGNDTSPCPCCGQQILAWADRCHHCGEYLGTEAWRARPAGRRFVWIVAVGLAIVSILWFLLQ